MWQYNYSIQSDELMHRDHKYLDRYKGKNGKWVYVYNKLKSNKISAEKGGYNEGARNRQKWAGVDVRDKNGEPKATATVLSGSNREDRYAGIMVGKVKDDYDYVEKSKKIGGVTVNYDNENGTHNLSVHIDHKTVDKGKNTVKKLLGIK